MPSFGRTSLWAAVSRSQGGLVSLSRGPQVGATQVLDGTTDPAWTGETFVVPLAHPVTRWIERAALRGNRRARASPAYVEPILRLEMYDYNTLFKDVTAAALLQQPGWGMRMRAGLCRSGLAVAAADCTSPRGRRITGPRLPVQVGVAPFPPHVHNRSPNAGSVRGRRREPCASHSCLPVSTSTRRQVSTRVDANLRLATQARTTHARTGLTHVAVKVFGCVGLCRADTFSESDPYVRSAAVRATAAAAKAHRHAGRCVL